MPAKRFIITSLAAATVLIVWGAAPAAAQKGCSDDEDNAYTMTFGA
jgi:hypothetical protein